MSRRRYYSNKVYCTDPKLLPRIKEQLSISSSCYPSIEDLIDTLQDRYPEYKRKKYNSFKEQVTKIYRSISDELEPVERNHLIKKRVESEGEGSMCNDDDDHYNEVMTDSDVELAHVVKGNVMNDLLVQVYNTKPQETMKSHPLTDTTHKSHPSTSDTPRTPHSLKNTVDTSGGVAMETTITPQSTSSRKRRGLVAAGESVTKIKKRKKGSLDEETADALKEKHFSDIPLIYPGTRFIDIGGYDTIIKKVCELMLDLQHPEIFQHLGISSPRGLLLNGPPGSGKSLMAHAIAGELGWPLLKLAATEIVSGVSGETEEKLRKVFQRAKEHSPCVILLDEIDSISPKRETAQREMEKRIVTQLGACMDDIGSSLILVIGTTNRIDSIDACLRRAGRFDKEISLGIPDEMSRKHILEVLCRKLRVDKELNYSRIAHLTPGYVGADLSALVREASLTSVNASLLLSSSHKSCDSHVTISELSQLIKQQVPLSSEQLETLLITENDFKLGLENVQPSSIREGFATVPDVTWNDIGALESVRAELTLSILAPVRFPEHFSALGLKQPPGILLAGPPGCGKTLLAKAIANESGINFISVKGPELLNMYVGESERAVRQVFQRAKNSAPCVIFFDEIDALCPRRSDVAESSSSARVVNQVLTEMDGMVARKQVFVVGATNRPDMIDPAILRPGRLDKILHVGLPSPDERVAILKAITKDGTCPVFGDDVNLSLIANDARSNGFSGADLAALVREAAILALKEIMSFSLSSLSSSGGLMETNTTMTSSPPKVLHKHFEEAFLKVTPSVSHKVVKSYKSL